jgi:phage recombination protein Bet
MAMTNTNAPVQKSQQLSVSYESAFGTVSITSEDVRKYLVRGNGAITDQEVKLFLELCKYQKLNPFVGEAYPIKFGSEFQLVVGYEAYKRRAEENPTYAGRKSGIVVLRGEEVLQKEGTCLYPSEVLIGGWCRVNRKKGGEVEETYKEVALTEYQKMKEGRPAANWGTKPCTMIEKVAVSQALRAAFPTDYAGMYTPEEAEPEGYVDVEYQEVEIPEDDPVITQEQRQQMLRSAHSKYGDGFKEFIVAQVKARGYTSTTDMPVSIWSEIMDVILTPEEPESQVEPESEDGIIDVDYIDVDESGLPWNQGDLGEQ